MERALGGLCAAVVGRRAAADDDAATGGGGSEMAASAAAAAAVTATADSSSVPPPSAMPTEDRPRQQRQQTGKKEQGATNVVVAAATTTNSSSSNHQQCSTATGAIIPPSHYCFISIEEEINNNINSTPSTDRHCFSLLRRFYDELMTPAFPLEEERDDISDWLWCFSTQMHSRQYPQHRQRNITTTNGGGGSSNDNDESNVGLLRGATMEENDNNTENQRRCVMDVILMIQKQQHQDSDNDNHSSSSSSISNKQSTILGGAVIAYYRNSRVGLLSYVVLNEEYRGCGLAKLLHNEALRRMEMLANSYCFDSIINIDNGNNHNSQNDKTTAALRAIFAETNTHTAGDITPTQCLLRHKSLYNLGYRRLNFPYSQPPLSPEDGSNASFDDIMLLVYLPLLSNDDDDHQSRRMNQNNNNDSSFVRYSSWFFEKNETNQFVNEDEDDNNEGGNNLLTTTTVKMDVNIPLGFVEDFYISQGFRRDAAACGSDYRTADYYKFAHWFADRCHLKQREQQGCGGSGVVEVSLHRPNIAPWEDIKESLLHEWTEEVRKNKPQDPI